MKKITLTAMALAVTLCTALPAFAMEKEQVSTEGDSGKLGVTQKLEINPGVWKEVVLPFEYAKAEDLKKSDGSFWPLLREGQYTALTGEKKVIVGPLKPCMLIMFEIKYPEYKTLVFHEDYASDIVSMFDIVSQEFGESLKDKGISVNIFTNEMKNYKDMAKVLAGCDDIGVQDYLKRSQAKDLRNVQSTISEKLSIPKEKIKWTLHKSPYKDYELGDYEFAEMSVLVGPSGWKSVCLMHENFFNLSLKPDVETDIVSKTAAFQSALTKDKDTWFMQRFGVAKEDDAIRKSRTYRTRRFLKLRKEEK